MLTIEDIGRIVSCPKCGEQGRVSVERVSIKGHTYHYLTVRHPKGHAYTKRCLIRRLTEEEVSKLVSKQAKVTVTKTVTKQEEILSPEEVSKLKYQLEQLKQENEQLKAQLQVLQNVQHSILAAKSLTINREQAEALKLTYIDKRSGLPAEIRETARSVLWGIVGGVRESGIATVLFTDLSSLVTR